VRYFQDDPTRWEEMVRMGAWGQITSGSIVGRFGSETREFSEQLLRKGQVHVLASDAHNLRGRPPMLSEALGVVSGLVGDTRARSMVEDVPRALLDGVRPEIPPLDVPSKKKRSFLGRWFGGG
jgi:protein-tyrosine phosphatase